MTIRKIKDIDFNIASTGNPVTKLTFEDAKDSEFPTDIYGDENMKYILSTKDIGDEIDIIQSGKWMNIKIDDEKPKFSKLCNNFFRMLKKQKDDREVVALDFVKDELSVWLLFDEILFDLTLDQINESKSKRAKAVRDNLDLPVAKQTLNPYLYIQNRVDSFKRSFERKYIASLTNEDDGVKINTSSEIQNGDSSGYIS